MSVIIAVHSSALGDRLYRNHCSADPALLLRMSDPPLLEATQGKGSEEGTEGSRRPQERTTPGRRHEGKSMFHIFRSVCQSVGQSASESVSESVSQSAIQ